MRQQQKANRVSWAPGANLCQVKYFQTADRPCEVGRRIRDHPKSKALNSYHVVSDSGSANAKFKIPQVQWKTPPELVLRSNWHVAVGQKSEEIEVQKHRENRVLEAVYPRLSAVPPNPLISSDVEGQFYDDMHTSIVPIIPIEETAAMDLSPSEAAPQAISIDSEPANLLQGPSTSTLNIPSSKSETFNNGKSALVLSHGLQGDPAIAAAAAANAILGKKEPRSLIDHGLLKKLLENPEMTQKLINEHRLSSITETGTSESKVWPAVPLPSSLLLIDKSDTQNSKPSDAGIEAISRPLTVKLSSSAHVQTGTASGPKLIQPSVSLLGSTNDLLIKISSHENNQSENCGNAAATQTAEQLLAANTRMGRGSGPENIMLSASRTSSICDLLSKKSTGGQPVSTGSRTVTKLVKPSLASNPKIGTFSQPKQVALSVSLSSSPHDLPSKKPTNEHGQPANNGSVAMLKPVTDEIRTGSAPKTGTPSLSLPISVHDLAGKNSTSEHNQQANTGNVVVPKLVVTQSVAADTGFGTGFRVKTGISPFSLPISVNDLPGKKFTSEHNQQDNTGAVVVTKPVVTQSIAGNTGTGTGFRTNTGTPPVSLTSLVYNFPGKISTGEHNQEVNTGTAVVPKSVVTQPVAMNIGIGTGFRIKTGATPVCIPISVHDLPCKKSINEQNQQVNTGNMVLPKPAVTHSVAVDAGTGLAVMPSMSLPILCPENQQVNAGNVVVSKPVVTKSAAASAGIGMKVMPLVSFPTLSPGILCPNSGNEKYHSARTENVTVPRPLMQSLAANSTNGTGFRPVAVNPSVPFRSSTPDICSKKPTSEPCQLANAVAGRIAENQPLPIPRINTLINVAAGPVAENQPLSIPRKNAELLGTPPNFGSLPVPKPVHLTGPNIDVSRLRKLIDEHGAHVRDGDAPAAGINAIFPKPSKPDLEMLRKMVNKYGIHNNVEIPSPRSEPLLIPSPLTSYGALVLSRDNGQPLPAALSASPYSAPATPQPKDMQYCQSLIKQQNVHELLQQNKHQNCLQGPEATQNTPVVEFEPKFQKPCLYYNTPKGCRNGSRCRFLHDLSKQWRSGGVLEAPSGKRMKPDGELIGGT